MDVSKNSGTPKWMVYNGNPIKMDDLGVPLVSETSICLGMNTIIFPMGLLGSKGPPGFQPTGFPEPRYEHLIPQRQLSSLWKQ